MKIVIIGNGKVGFTLAQALSREGHDLVVVDNQRAALNSANDRLDVMVVEGNGASASVQRQADVGNSDLLIAVTSADETNFLCCMVARKLGCKHTIARVRNAEYSEAQYLLREELGLNMVVDPEKIAAREIFGLLQYPSFLQRDSFAKGRAEIVAVPVHNGGSLDGMPLQELYKVLKAKVLICAVERGEEVFIPGGSFVLHGGDHIYVTAPAKSLLSLVRLLGLRTSKVKSAMLIGGSRIAIHLAKMLTDAGIRVKLLEKDLNRCEVLSELLPAVQVTHADGTSFHTLMSEGIDDTDAVVTLTNLEEQNLVVSMYATNMHVPKVVTKINRIDYGDFMRDMGTDCIICPRLLVSSDILRYVRAMDNSQGEHMIALHRIVGDKVEALEFRANKNTWYVGVPLKDIPISKNILIAAISHRGNVIIPRGDDCFYEGDSVVIVTAADRSVGRLNDIFSARPKGV